MRTITLVADALRARGVIVEAIATTAPGSAGQQALGACDQGADHIFACGGDGTIHEVLQGMAFHPTATLGVIPLGTANALARHLRLSLDPVAAALQQLDYVPRVIPLGLITCQSKSGEHSRYFAVMAGAGPDGALVYRMLAGGKHRLGRTMYYLRAAALFARAKFRPFTVEIALGTKPSSQQQAVSAMTVRVGNLGGLFSPLVHGGSLTDPYLLLALVSAPAGLSLPAWFAMSWTRMHRWNPYVRTATVEGFTCGGGDSQPVQVQADGEWIGRTPMSVKLVPNAVRLLLPPAGPRP